MTGTETVLIIDDEASIRELAETILTKLGYAVLTAADGSEGLALLNSRNGDVDLVLLDLTMPGMPGETVLRRIARTAPSVNVIIASGHSRESVDKDILALASGHLSKPFQLHDLSVAIRTALDRPGANHDVAEACSNQ
jgi:DNA-binding NtrC family response regulator